MSGIYFFSVKVILFQAGNSPTSLADYSKVYKVDGAKIDDILQKCKNFIFD